ncbi:MAG: S4 domain-containing protein, partial [Vicinamibacterales bacterium]
FKTRSEAQRACKVGRVSVNGAVAKPHREVRAGDEIVLSRPAGRRQTVVVRLLADRHVSRADARELYQDRTPPPTGEQVEMRRMEGLFKASTGATRLDRRGRRDVARRKWTT